MNKAKIHLSKKEMQLINRGDWILTKNAIVKKVQLLFGETETAMMDELRKNSAKLPVEIFSIRSKISKGENYEGLPYLVLDCPRYFKAKNIFAIRTMFWWGNFFSITLHLSGIYKNQLQNKFIDSFARLEKEKFYCCHNADQWEHHFEKTNYLPFHKLGKHKFEKLVAGNSFIKIARKIPLQKWDKAGVILCKHFKTLIEIAVN